MEFRNYPNDEAHEAIIRGMLAPGEQLIAIMFHSRRWVSVTNQRLLIHEIGGRFLAIRNSLVAAVEVSDRPEGGKFLGIHFGGGLERTIVLADEEQADLVVSATNGTQS